MTFMRIFGLTRVFMILLVGGLAFAQSDTKADPVVLFVNELPVFASEYYRAQLENPAATLPNKGFFKIDRDNLALANVVKTQAIQADASNIEVSSSEVDKEINDMIKQNDWDFQEFKQNLETASYSVETYRRQIRQQLRSQRRIAQIKNQIKVTPEELRFYFSLFKTRYTINGKILPFEQVQTKIETDARTIKTNAALEQWSHKLMSSAKFRVPENSSLEVYNPIVAKIGSTEIELWTLNQLVYNNANITNPQSLGQNLALDIQKLKTSTLEKLIDQHLAISIAKKSGKPFIGSGKDLLEAVKSYQVQNLKVTDSEAKNYYQTNTASFKTQGSATFRTFGFSNLTLANAFREELIRNKRPVDSIVSKYTQDRTTKFIQSSADLLAPEAKKVLFNQKLIPVKNGYITQAAKINTRVVVFLVQTINYPKIQPYQAVKTEVLQKTLEQKRQNMTKTWLQAARKNFKLENQLEAILKDSETRGNRVAALVSQPSTSTTPTAQPEPRTPTPEPDPRIPSLRP